MGYKGHTTIQLFNAKTGELEKETNDDNMVTDAITKLLNPPYDMMVGDSLSVNSCYNKFMPIRTVGMAGIVLFADRKTEIATNDRINFNDTIVGHAGSVYSGTNAFRGTYNQNESKALTNGYKHVWDFASDRACGDISCVCLTSKAGGDGAKYNSTDKVTAFSECGYLYNENSSSPYKYFIGQVAKNLYCSIEWTDTNKATLIYSQKFNSDAVSLIDTAGNGMRVVSTKVIQHNLNAYFQDGSYYVDNTGILRCTYGSKVLEINILTGALVTAETISLTVPDGYYDFASYGNIVCDLKNHYVALIRNKTPANSSYPYEMWLFTHAGAYVKRLGTAGWTGNSYTSSYDQYLDAIRLFDDVWLNQDGETAKRYIHNDYQRNAYSYKDIFPYYLYRYQNSIYNYNNAYLCINNAYLASINNLATMVTKTSQQTMKVTYTITES